MPHYTRPIGGASTSDAKPDWWCYLRRKCRGEVVGNLHTLAHAQFGRWTCTNQNVYTYSCPYVSADAIGSCCGYKLGGYVHASAPAPIGSRRDVHKSTHAKYRSCSNIGVLRNDQTERWGQCNLRYPLTAEWRLKPWHHVQGGVVESKQRFGEHGPWHSSSDRDPLRCISVVSVKSLFMHVECVSELSVIVLLLHGGGASIVPRRVVGLNSSNEEDLCQ